MVLIIFDDGSVCEDDDCGQFLLFHHQLALDMELPLFLDSALL